MAACKPYGSGRGEAKVDQVSDIHDASRCPGARLVQASEKFVRQILRQTARYETADGTARQAAKQQHQLKRTQSVSWLYVEQVTKKAWRSTIKPNEEHPRRKGVHFNSAHATETQSCYGRCIFSRNPKGAGRILLMLRAVDRRSSNPR